jgi:hypothetical protein
MWISSRENSDLTVPVSPYTENLRNVHVPPFDVLPLYRHAVVPLWVSPQGKPLF